MPAVEQEPPRRKSMPVDSDLIVGSRKPAPKKEKPPFFHRRWVVIGAAILAAIAVLYGGKIFFHSMTHESTDDAFIDAHIISVAPKIAGRVSSVAVRDNQFVKRGDLLVQLDPRDVEAMVAQRNAAVDVAKAKLTNAQLSAEQAQAHVHTLAAAYAAAEASVAASAAEAAKQQSDLQRNQTLLGKGAVSKQEFEHSKTDTAAAEANLESKQKQLQAAAALAEEAKKQAGSAGAQVTAAKAEVAQAQAELEQAKLQRSYTRITAPEAGRITNKSVEPGSYVQVGQPMLALVPRQVWVTANFKETQLADMKPGQPAEIDVDAYPGRALHGHVDSIQAGSGARFSLLPPENATGNFVKVVQRVPVKIVFDEQPSVQQVLGPGMSAVPDVKVKGAFGPAIIVGVIVLVALFLIVVGTMLWLAHIRKQ